MLLTRRRALQLALGSGAWLWAGAALKAQVRESALSDAEIERLRDTAYFPPERVLAFISFLDKRTLDITKLSAGKRRPGREEDLHERMEQFTSIAEDLDDNLDDYSRRRRDIRKVLPKLVAATERWSSEIRTPPDHEAYSVSRKLALEAVADVREAAVRLLEEQRVYFLAHPPDKEDSIRPDKR